MIALFFGVLAHAAPTLWSGLPPELAALDLETPSHGPPMEGVPEGALRYALHPGTERRGLVALYVTPSVPEAERVFDGLARTAATHWPPAEVPLAGDRAQGDGLSLVLVRFDNVVVLVRDPHGRAASVAAQVRGSLVPRP